MTPRLALSATALVLGVSALTSALQSADETGLGNLQVHGFASQGALKTSANNDLADGTKRGTADFNEFGLAVRDQVNDQLSVGLQLFARDLGHTGKDAVGLDWAYGDYHWRDALGVRAGKIRVPLGLYNESRDIDLARVGVLLPQVTMYNENFRDNLSSFIGGEAYGDLDGGKAGSLDYQVFGGGMQLPDDNSIRDQVQDTGAVTVSSITFKDVWGGQALWNTPLPGLRAGASYYHSDWRFAGAITVPAPTPTGFASLPLTADNHTDIVAASGEYINGNLTLASEYCHARTVVDQSLSFIPETIGIEQGWYVLAGWRFNHWLSAAGSFMTMHSLTNLPTAQELGYQKDGALSLRFDPVPHWLIKLEGHYIAGDASLLRQNNPQAIDATGGFHPAQHFWLAAAKTTFSF
jgi:hypothetical protein